MSADLEERVAALEVAAERLGHPLMIAESPPLSEEDAARFKEEFEAAAKQFPQHEIRLLPSPPPLTPDEVRQLLRESVTVVKPGEVLFFSYGDPNATPSQLREIQDWVSGWLELYAPDVHALVLPHGSMAAAESGPD